jgi:crotonobetainyl-CoA:carnitine CoA-transferase CaiB-like acyl-CoA transferase
VNKVSILPSGFTTQLNSDGLATQYAGKLLNDLGADVIQLSGDRDDHPARRWAQSGLMAITGIVDQSPLMCPAPLASCGDGAMAALRSITNSKIPENLSGADLMAERAAILGLHRNGANSPGGSCRIIPSLDGRIAINLARASDWEQLPAWLQHDISPDWQSVARSAATRPTVELLERGRLLGLAVADTIPSAQQDASWLQIIYSGEARSDTTDAPRVLDLSSLWAGPLCSHLWQLAGAQVIKVESTRRPDGARGGSSLFFDLLNHGKLSVALDLHTSSGRQQLLELIHHADIVLEGSRPRALRQMGIIAEDLVADRPGLTWVSISGYGRDEPQANWIAYGDDAGVAAGLSAIMHEATGQWVICGDAIADPLTGLHAALAGWASWRAGGGHLMALSLYQTVRHCLGATDTTDCDLHTRQKRWSSYLLNNKVAVRQAVARSPGGAAALLGADTDDVLSQDYDDRTSAH